jgi:hypothetical protein
LGHQQNEDDEGPGVLATPVPSFGLGRLDVSVIVAVRRYGAVELSGVGATGVRGRVTEL